MTTTKEQRVQQITETIRELAGNGQFFGVTFTKKDGTRRKMVARLDVRYDGEGADRG